MLKFNKNIIDMKNIAKKRGARRARGKLSGGLK